MQSLIICFLANIKEKRTKIDKKW